MKFNYFPGDKENMQVRLHTQYKVMPWSNGKGTTTELYVFPKGSKLTDNSAVWRISMASVTENGSFSQLPDYERIIALAKGNGFRLTGNMGTNVEIVPGVIHTFSGQEAISCELLGAPCLDLNIMYKREEARASLSFLGQADPAQEELFLKSNKETIIAICLEGRATVQANGKPIRNLFPQDSVIFSSNNENERLVVKTQANSKAALVTIEVVSVSLSI